MGKFFTQDREIICIFSQVSVLGHFSRTIHESCSGLGLAAILSRASQITDSMVEASSMGLANSLTDEEVKLGLLYPRIERSTFHAFFLYYWIIY